MLIRQNRNQILWSNQPSLKTWLFTIASNLAKDNLRAQKRWTEDATDIAKEAALSNKQFFQEAMNIRMTSPHGHFEAKEHIALCFTCISKSLPLEQQLCVFLKEVYEFKVSEITSFYKCWIFFVRVASFSGFYAPQLGCLCI